MLDTDRDWLLWAIECAEMFGRRWRALPGQPRWNRPPDITSCELPPRPAAVRVAREFAQRTVHDWRLDGLSANVGLVVSELVTNALRHAPVRSTPGLERWSIQLSLAGAGPHVMCAVTDPSSATPLRKPGDPSDESGRGLHLVDFFSDGWGWLPRSTDGKVVWALFHLPE